MDIASIRSAIGNNIRHWRIQRGLSEEMAATHLAIKIKRLQKYESGGESPTCDELIELAMLFHCSVDDLCQETS
jgi:transcriptional regulator with XRE-family HTH domain